MVLIEVLFDAVYLLFAFVVGLYMLADARGSVIVTLYGVLALTLVFGDAFHLLPRIYCQWKGTMKEHYRLLGFGKGVTSVTMTLFYVLLYYIWQIYFQVSENPALTIIVFVLAGLRIMLCLFPQNGWLEEKPSFQWVLWRNIPFAILGAVLIVLFAMTGEGSPFTWMPLAVTLSFVFKIIVVLFSDKCKPLGAFMLPKTCMYVWVICMGFALL